MATIRNTLMMKDSMGSVLKNVITSMDMTISTMERLNTASDNIDLSGNFEAAKQQIGLARHELGLVDDEIRKASEEQDNFNNKVRDGTFLTRGLRSMLTGLGGLIGVQKLVNTSDEMVQIDARLNLLTNNEAATDTLKKQIFASANDARGLYTDMASSVTKLGLLAGHAFSNTDEMVAFTNTFQKMGTIAGASTSQLSSAVHQLNQAMASGRLQGDEYVAIIENAPLLAQAIADYAGIGIDELKKFSSEGLITADIIKGAMFSVADDVNEQFASMPMTWGQVWNGVVNKLLMWTEPLLGVINLLANNWSIIEPIVIGVAAAILTYTVATKGAAAAIAVWTTAQTILTSVMALNPWTIGAIGLILFISLIYAGVAALNKFTGTSISATGIVAGVFTTLVAHLYNGFIVQMWNYIAAFVNFFANVFNNPVAAIKILFYDLAQTVIGYILNMASAIESIINKIPGVKINITSGLDNFYNQLELVSQKAKDESQWVEAVKSMDYIGYDDAWKKGYQFGEGIADKVSGTFNFDSFGGFDTDDLIGGLKDEEFNVNVKDDVNLADENLKYLLDSVTQKYINEINLQAPAPEVSVNFYGEINRDVDLDDLAEKTKQKIGTEMVEYVMSSTDIVH